MSGKNTGHDFVHRSIDHDESDSMSGYSGVVLKSLEEEIFRSNTGRPIADWWLAAEAARDLASQDGVVMNSSSVDHFLHDVPGFRMIERAGGEIMIGDERDRPLDPVEREWSANLRQGMSPEDVREDGSATGWTRPAPQRVGPAEMEEIVAKAVTERDPDDVSPYAINGYPPMWHVATDPAGIELLCRPAKTMHRAGPSFEEVDGVSWQFRRDGEWHGQAMSATWDRFSGVVSGILTAGGRLETGPAPGMADPEEDTPAP